MGCARGKIRYPGPPRRRTGMRRVSAASRPGLTEPASNEPGLIEIDSLTKRFGSFTAVDAVSFSVAKGEVLGFLGPNGAGKSTTMRMITGFIPPTSGTVAVGGFDITEHPIPAKKLVGY